ncbi:MAG: ABC transporter ATP-binding protein [Planctomycetota bacterium]
MSDSQIPLREALRLGALAGRRTLCLHLGLSIVEGLLPLAGIFAMRLLVDAVTESPGSGSPEEAYSSVLDAVYLAAGIAIGGAVLRAFASYVADRHGRIVTDRCADRMLEQSSSLDLQQLEDPRVLDLMQRAGQEVAGRPARIASDLSASLLSLVTLATMGTLLLLVDPWLTALVLVFAVPGVWLRLRHAKRLFAWQRDTVEAQREVGYLSTILSTRQAAKDLRALSLARRFLGRVQGQRTDLREQALGLSARRARGELVGQVLSNAALFFAYGRLGWLAVSGAFTVGAFVMYAQAVQRSQSGVRDLLGSLAALSEHRLFLRTFVEFEALEPSVVDSASPIVLTERGPLAVRCQDVHFTYPGGRAVLSGVDFEIAPGERVALVGRNGSGKSTLVRLLTRLADPTTGAIRYGESPLRELELATWRGRVGVLFQDATPLDLTVRENIAPDGGGDPESWRDAARQAGALERIERLPGAFEQRLGRRFAGGAELSAGEWRRILLARVLHRRSEFLILDEPSAFLDARASRELGERLRDELKGRSVLVVDHRPEAVQWVDRVLVLEEGRIVESGSPAELAAKDGSFRKLFGAPASG